MGFSDFTVLNIAIWVETGLVTFNGPALLTDFAEYPRMFAYTERNVLRVLCQPEPMGPIEPSTWWTEEFLDWERQLDLERPRKLQSSPGWTWLRDGDAEGLLIGGCLESLEHLRGTRFWPQWQGAVFFFELAGRSPVRVDSLLMDYENMGVLEMLSGLIVGRPMGYSCGEREDLRRVILGGQASTASLSSRTWTSGTLRHSSPYPLGADAGSTLGSNASRSSRQLSCDRHLQSHSPE
jgi:muramoyltetrapeptide carboxypeptidase LdcA involved in peptidoglycan recycling